MQLSQFSICTDADDLKPMSLTVKQATIDAHDKTSHSMHEKVHRRSSFILVRVPA